MMYATPVIYPFSQIPERYAVILAWNPLAPIIESVRHGFLGTGAFQPLGIIYSLTFSITIFFAACIVFNRVEKTFMDTV
jgi:lipopolysaccharide transport system permease protein